MGRRRLICPHRLNRLIYHTSSGMSYVVPGIKTLHVRWLYFIRLSFSCRRHAAVVPNWWDRLPRQDRSGVQSPRYYARRSLNSFYLPRCEHLAPRARTPLQRSIRVAPPQPRERAAVGAHRRERDRWAFRHVSLCLQRLAAARLAPEIRDALRHRQHPGVFLRVQRIPQFLSGRPSARHDD